MELVPFDDREWKNKYVTEMTEETQENLIDDIGDSTGKPVAEAGPKQASIPTTSSPTVTLPYHQRRVDRRRTRAVRQKLFRCVKKDD